MTHPKRSRKPLPAALRLLAAAAALALSTGAAASVNTGQIFVQTGDTARLEAAVAAYLEGWSARPDSREDAWFQADAGGRRVVVLPPRGGWATVLEATHEVADPALAEALSRALGAKVVWVEVLGRRLSWRNVVLDKGRIVQTHVEPRPGYGGAHVEGPMPPYRDVESLAWAFLIEQGVPAAYRFLQQGMVGVAEDPKKGPQATVFKVVPEGEGLKVGAGRFGFRLPERGKTAPAMIDALLPPEGEAVQAGRKAEGQAIDLIGLTGEPTPERVENLVRVLLRIQDRYGSGESLRFCHLVDAPYGDAVYPRLAQEGGPCAAMYAGLAKARAEGTAEAPAGGPAPGKAKK